MRKLNYRLIASDFDGTLLNDEHEIPEKVKKAITEYTENGGIFAVCTGRMLRCILPNVRSLGLKGLVVAHQGCVIADIESGKIIKNVAIDYQSVAEICSAVERLGHHVNVYSNDNMYTTIEKDTPYLKKYEKIVGIDSIFVEEKMSDFVLKNKLHAQKASILIEPENRDKLYADLCALLGEKYDVTCSAKVLVEISSKQEDKGTALKFIAEKYDIPIESTVGIGDSLNDVKLLQAAGLAVAVKNAEDALKATADFISVSNNDGAVAQIIEKFGFA